MKDDIYIVRCFASDWPTIAAGIAELENEAFDENIRETTEELGVVAKRGGGICLLASIGQRVAGYALAAPMETFLDIRGVDNDMRAAANAATYLTSVAVKKAYRGQGLGVILQARCVAISAEEGRPHLAAHIRTSSIPRHPLVSAVNDTYPDWYGTGQSYSYVDLSLARTT